MNAVRATAPASPPLRPETPPRTFRPIAAPAGSPDPAPVLAWGHNGLDERDRLQAIVNRLHALHPLAAASAGVGQGGWKLDVVARATGLLTTIPNIDVRSPDEPGTLSFRTVATVRRDLLAELAEALDQAATYVTRPILPPFAATLAAMAVLRSATTHECFAEIVSAPIQPPHAEWKEGGWVLWSHRYTGSIHPGNGLFVEYERGDDGWWTRRGSHTWDHNGSYLFILDASLPVSACTACTNRPLDEVADLPDLKGSGLVVRSVVPVVRGGVPALRIGLAKRRLASLDDALSMSRAMDAAGVVPSIVPDP